jgi:hypothetical protein
MKEATKIIETIVDQMDNSIRGEYNASDGRTYFCDTKWARKGKTISDALSNVFTIVEIVPDEYIVAEPVVVEDPPLTLDGLCFLTPPFFITGTKLSTNREWTIANDHLENKLPLIWQLEIINETGYGRESAIERDIDLNLFFLDETDPSQYYTKDHREQVVQPMMGLMGEFLKTVDRLRGFQTIDQYTYKTFSRFGVEDQRGVIQNILDANLSGLSLNVQIRKMKENCKC